jgi:hypothetical protein
MEVVGPFPVASQQEERSEMLRASPKEASPHLIFSF